MAATAAAVDHEGFIDNRRKDEGIPRYPASDGRQGGEMISTAVVIPGLPFADQATPLRQGRIDGRHRGSVVVR